MASCSQGVIAQSRIVLSDVTVINPSGSAVLRPHLDIVIEGQNILAVRPHKTEPASSRVEFITLSGAFVLPGFIDTHAHTLLSPRASDGRILPKPSRDSTEMLLRSLLEFGITAVRDPGDPTQAVVGLRDQVAGGVLPGPTMFVAGRILNATAPGPEFVTIRTRDEYAPRSQRKHAKAFISSRSIADSGPIWSVPQLNARTSFGGG
jgi:imidazolonepropionase-like amidohydrolase